MPCFANATTSKSPRRPVKSEAGARSPDPLACRCPRSSACTRAASQETEAEPAIPVIAEPVRLGTIRASISATGVVATLPGAAFAVVATQPARIAEITKNVGDPVKSGEMLVRFEFPSLRAQTAVNEAAVKAADLRVQAGPARAGTHPDARRQGRRFAQPSWTMPIASSPRPKAELAVAKAALSVVQAQGGNTTIRAPFDGTVTERLHNPGDSVRADESDPILRLIDPKQVQVMATLPVADTTRFVVGATARAIAEGQTTAGSAEGRDAPGSGKRREDRRRDARLRHTDRTAAGHAGRHRNRRRTAIERPPRPGDCGDQGQSGSAHRGRRRGQRRSTPPGRNRPCGRRKYRDTIGAQTW